MIVLLWCCLCSALVTAWLAERKGYRPWRWFWLGALLGLFATLALLSRPTLPAERA